MLASCMVTSWMAAPWRLLFGCLMTDFGHVQKFLVILQTLGKLNINPTAKLPLNKLDVWATFWATYPCHWHSTLASQTCEGLHQLWALPGLLSVAYFSWLLWHPVFQFISLFPTQSVGLPLVTYSSMCSTCVTYRTPCHATGHQLLPTQPIPSEVEDSPRSDKHFKHVPLLTYLIYFSLKEVYMVGLIYMPKSPQGTLISLSLVLNQRFKSSMC